MKTMEKVLVLGSALLLAIGASRCSLDSAFTPDMLPPDVDLADSEVDLAELPDLAMPMDMAVPPPDLALPQSPTLSAVSPASGMNSAATNLTLTGTNFRAGATVTVGGQTCSNPVVVSATQITCTAPARAATCGLQAVVVTNADKSSAMKSAFSYRPASVSFGTPTALNGTLTGPHMMVTADV